MPLECNKANMTALVVALESGHYEQAEGLLRGDPDGEEPGGYCCVGVACDISGQGRWMKSDQDEWNYVTTEGYSPTTAPPSVVEWLGLKKVASDLLADLAALPLSPFETGWGNGETVTSYHHGTTLNDDGETFAQIARRIRETYLDEPQAGETP